jgi:hypothetical protein
VYPDGTYTVDDGAGDGTATAVVVVVVGEVVVDGDGGADVCVGTVGINGAVGVVNNMLTGVGVRFNADST